MPIILPTEERVERMLSGTKQPRDKIIGRMRPTAFREAWAFDVEKVAVNAVMAGARPEYLPVILAMSASGITARSSSTTSWATISVVNGPIRNEIGMNSGIGAMGPYNHANTTIGRAYGLLSQNAQGGSTAGRNLHGLARQQLGLHARASRRTRSGARGRRSTSTKASSRRIARCRCSSAAGTRTPATGRARPGRKSSSGC